MSVDDKVKHTGLLTRNKLFDHSVSIPEVLPMVSFAIWCCQNANVKTECNLQSLSAEKTVYTNLPKHDEVKALSHYCGRTLKIWVIYESNSLVIIWRYHSSSPLGRGTVYWMSRKFSPIFSGVKAERRGREGGGRRCVIFQKNGVRATKHLRTQRLRWRSKTRRCNKSNFLLLIVSAPPGCQPCPKSDEGLFDTPICGKNGIAYKNFCYLTLRNCIAKILKKEPVFPSSDPKTCG